MLKAIVARVKRHPTDMEKVFAHHSSNKGLYPVYVKALIELYWKQAFHPIKKGERDRNLLKEEIQMVQMYEQMFNVPSPIREMQIRTTVKYDLNMTVRLSD